MPVPAHSPDFGAVWHYGDPFSEQRSAEHDAVVVDRSHRAVLSLTGAGRRAWLHSISTQHLTALADGACTENLSLDGQGRVEDHWQQTELGSDSGGVTYLDTEPRRGEALLGYLQKMVFWSDAQPAAADLAVLSLIGPKLAEPEALAALESGHASRHVDRSRTARLRRQVLAAPDHGPPPARLTRSGGSSGPTSRRGWTDSPQPKFATGGRLDL